MFNLDETPNPIADNTRHSVWVKSMKDVTVMACVSASGVSLPPLVIYHGKTIEAARNG